MVPLPRLADWYLRRSMQRLQEVEDLTTHEIVEIVVGFYYIGAGGIDGSVTATTSVPVRPPLGKHLLDAATPSSAFGT